MFSWRDVIAVALVALTPALALAQGTPFTPKYGLGKPATPREIAGWDIDVRPDGTGLAAGSGTVAQGQLLYEAKCASCHGTFGESNDYLVIAGGVGTLAGDQPVRSTGSKLNHATTLWDYIRRAMPFTAPQSLTADETYALTAYVLHLSDILPADAALDQDSIVALKLPNRDGFTTDHGLMRRAGRPDTRNVACMHDCIAGATLASQIPEHARNDHGDLAEQTRGLGTSATARTAAMPPVRDAAAIARRAACTGCHGVSTKLVGPSFDDIAARYAGDAGAAARLAAKVRAGGSGVWGAVAMPAQPQVTAADARAVVQWILAGSR
jgi:cytochrome c551/c552